MFWNRPLYRTTQLWLNWMRGLVLIGLVCVLFASSATPPSARAGSSVSCAPKWKMITSANTTSPAQVLHDAVALSANDVWAVGVYWGLSDPHALIEHWDGNQWQIVEGASLTAPISELYAVDALSNTDVWAAGYTNDGQTGNALVERWNGSTWSTLPITDTTALQDIEVITDTNVWAVGSKILHWDGVQWTSTEIPVIGNESRILNSVHAIAADDIWAVGAYTNYDEINDIESHNTLVIHYDGANWNIVSAPNPEPAWNYLAAVHGIASDDVWAVGESNGLTTDTKPLILHWNGTLWSSSAVLNPSNAQDWLTDVVQLSSSQVIAVGTYRSADNHNRPLALHWDGTNWSQTDTGISKFSSNQFEGVSAGADGVVWTAGTSYTSNGSQVTLAARFAIPVSKPASITPLNGAVVPKPRVVLDWSDANCATHYELDVRQDSKTGIAVDGATNLAASKYKTITLLKGHDYFWRTRGCTDLVCGAWSKWSKFILQP